MSATTYVSAFDRAAPRRETALRRWFVRGSAPEAAAPLPAVEDHDLNDIGLVLGAVPDALWSWRRARRG